tara:strand:+ start:211 stop:774 length:564 start_codon:yes stop_codon:yes gene_type:complete
MICEILDDIFDQEYLHQLHGILEYKINWNANNIANRNTFPYGKRGTHKLFGSTILQRTGLNNIQYCDTENFKNFYNLYTYICQSRDIDPDSFLLTRICANLQHSGCDGTLHIDGGPEDKTIMVFPNPEWNSEWGGKFQVFSEDKKEMLEEYDYVPGRVIIFPAHLPHRGLGPIGDYLYRYSIVFGIT